MVYVPPEGHKDVNTYGHCYSQCRGKFTLREDTQTRTLEEEGSGQVVKSTNTSYVCIWVSFSMNMGGNLRPTFLFLTVLHNSIRHS